MVKTAGFTLIELIVVIAILGILALIAIPRFIGTLDTAKLRTDVGSARTIVSAYAVGEAEGTYVAGDDPTAAELATDGYLGEEPVSAQDDGAFSITYDADGVITSISAAGVEVYPAP